MQEFIEKRELSASKYTQAVTLEEAFKQLLTVAVEQFQDKKSDRATVNRKYINELETQICTDFIQVRGRAGKVLVLNQDRLLLLTNLTVGKMTNYACMSCCAALNSADFIWITSRHKRW